MEAVDKVLERGVRTVFTNELRNLEPFGKGSIDLPFVLCYDFVLVLFNQLFHLIHDLVFEVFVGAFEVSEVFLHFQREIR